MCIRAFILLGVLSMSIAGCGGGGGDNDPPPPSPPSGNISGLVIDLDGRPVANAQVTLAESVETTDTNGRFELATQQPGWVTVRHPQFISRTRAAFPEQPVLIRLTPDDGETIALHFAGDTMFGRRYYDPNNDGDTRDGLIQIGDEVRTQAQLLRYIQPLLANADITAANMESPLTNTPYFDPNQPRPAAFHPTKEFVFASHFSAAQTLREAGVDIIALGNNHMYDLLEPGVSETKTTLDAVGYKIGIGQFGAGSNENEAWRPALFSTSGLTVAFIGCTGIPGNDQSIDYVANMNKGGAANCTETSLRQAIKSAYAQAQIVVVMIHGGYEYGRQPSPFIQQLTATARTAGAALIINHHPHVVGGLNWQDGALTAWTLGNFLFDQDVWPTFESYLLAVHLRRGQVIRAYVEPFMIANYIPRPVIGQAADFVVRGAAGRNPGPFLVEDGAAEVDIGGRAIRQSVTVPLDSDEEAGTIYRLENGGWLNGAESSDQVLVGRDLFWTGSFEDETADDQSNPGILWLIDGHQDRLIGPEYAYEGQAGVRLKRLFSNSEDLTLTHKHRILNKPGQKFSVIGRARTNGNVSLQLSWYRDTIGASAEQTLVPNLVAPDHAWHPFRVDVTAPDFPEKDDYENQLPLKPAVSLFLRLSPPGRDRSTADFDNIRLIAWDEATLSSPQHDYLRVTGSMTATLQRDVLPGAEIWTPPPAIVGVP